MTITPSPLTNGSAWPRALKPTVLLCAHITANMGTAAQQVHYANRPNSPGPSAHDYLDPDGSGLEALDPAHYCAWSNGDVQGPNLSIPTVRAAVVAGVNPNKIVYREVECVGDGAHQVTPGQMEQLAQFVAADSLTTGLPINRSTVGTHADWNSVTRNNCAFRPSNREQSLANIIGRANAILHPAPPSRATYHMAIQHGTIQIATVNTAGNIVGYTPMVVPADRNIPSGPATPKWFPGHGQPTVAQAKARPISGQWVLVDPPHVVVTQD
jgi:hypothetical protein